MLYDVSIATGASPNKYWALLAFTDRRGELHEKQIQVERKATKNSNALQAAIDALEVLKAPCKVTIYAESEYMVEPFRQGWAAAWEKHGWKKTGGKPLKNADQWQQLFKAMEPHKMQFLYNQGEDNDKKERLAGRADKESGDTETEKAD